MMKAQQYNGNTERWFRLRARQSGHLVSYLEHLLAQGTPQTCHSLLKPSLTQVLSTESYPYQILKTDWRINIKPKPQIFSTLTGKQQAEGLGKAIRQSTLRPVRHLQMEKTWSHPGEHQHLAGNLPASAHAILLHRIRLFRPDS